MLRKLLMWAAAVAVVVAAAMPGATYAQGTGELATVEDLTKTSGDWLRARSASMLSMIEAQKVCDEWSYRVAKFVLTTTINDQLAQIDARLRSINASIGEQRVRQQRLAVELLFERERMIKRRAMLLRERYVPCDEEEEVVAAGNSLEVCDALGLSSITLSSDTNCLQISGEVKYEFSWGNEAQDDAPNDDTAQDAGEDFSDGASFWDFGANFQPSLNFGGMQTRGAFSTETPAPAQPVVPGYNFDTSFRGAGVKAEVSGTFGIGGFPVSLGAGLEFNNATASSSATNVAFPEGFGIPGVGPISGVFINSPTDLLQFDFTARRQLLTGFFEGRLPLSEGEFMLGEYNAGYRLGGLVGVRGGSFSQHETMTAVTSTPAYGVNAGATSIYETNFTGGFGGVYAGLSLDKNIPFGDDGLSFQEMFSVAVGYDMYRLDVDDHVVTSGLGGAPGFAIDQTNSFSVSGGVPTVELDASIGIGTADWMAGINTGFTVGKTALIDYQRLDDGGDPHTGLLAEIAWSIGASFTGRF